MDKYASSALNSMTLLIGTKAHPVLESFVQAACRAKVNNGDAAGAETLRRQFLSAMLRLQQQAQRTGRGMGAPSGAVPAAAGRGKKGRK